MNHIPSYIIYSNNIVSVFHCESFNINSYHKNIIKAITIEYMMMVDNINIIRSVLVMPWFNISHFQLILLYYRTFPQL